MTVFVLYGATGDLAKRMVLPAFFDLYARGLLPRRWKLVGNGRGDVAHEDFRGHVHDVLTEFGPTPTEEQWAGFAPRSAVRRRRLPREDPGSLPDLIEQTRGELGGDAAADPLPGRAAERVRPDHRGARRSTAWPTGTKVVYEKPYGTSLDSFRELDDLVHGVFDEEQVFRIDHFLGKEATQNVHMLRFANTMISPRLGSPSSIEEVQIDVPETLDIADRAEFYDATGAALDMLVTHLFQVAAEVAMEPPVSLRRRGPAGGPGVGDRRVPPARPGRGRARAVRRLSPDRGDRRRLDHRHVRGREAVGGHRPLARRAVPAAHRQAADGRRPAALAAVPGPGRAAALRRQPARGARLRPGGQRSDPDGAHRQGPGARLRPQRRRPHPPPGSGGRGLDGAVHVPASTTCSGATGHCSPARSGWRRRSPPSRRCSDRTARRSRPIRRAAGAPPRRTASPVASAGSSPASDPAPQATTRRAATSSPAR